MQRNPYRLEPLTCQHRSPLERHHSAGLVFFVCSGCGAVRKVWGRAASITALAAPGLGKLPLVKAIGGDKC